ncbi:glucoamylase family protein [Limibacter armeniacum]|uniref:glucoamylase family protein n=1 Tax=Limibacter armeniacum TaxID=466084 RepID=UPI002FE6624C
MRKWYKAISFLLFLVCAGLVSCNRAATKGNEEESIQKMASLPEEALLDTVQHQTFRYFYDFAHAKSGMARERSEPAKRGSAGVPNLENIVTTRGTGFGVMAFPVAVERGWITRDKAVNHLSKIVSFLESCKRFHGMWAHWYDGNTGKVSTLSKYDNGGDLVESAFLLQGLLTVREYFDSNSDKEVNLRSTITRLWEEAEWDWYTNGKPWLYWHWSPDYGFKINMPIMGFDESMIAYVLAVASPTHPIKPSLYQTGWAIDHNDRFKEKGDYVQRLQIGENNNSGGPLFFTHYSFLGLTPYITDKYVQEAGYADYATHNKAMVDYCYDWCLKHGYPKNCWGLTSSDDPEKGYRVHAAEVGRRGDNGTISPTAAISSIVYTPEKSLAFIRYLLHEHGGNMWKEYGFKDAFNLKYDWYAPAYLALDQGPMIIMIENYRTGLLWKNFMKNPEIPKALEKLGLKQTKQVL